MRKSAEKFIGSGKIAARVCLCVCVMAADACFVKPKRHTPGAGLERKNFLIVFQSDGRGKIFCDVVRPAVFSLWVPASDRLWGSRRTPGVRPGKSLL